MKTRTNQPVFLDNGNPVDDSKLGGTQLYKHHLSFNFTADGEESEGYLDFISINNSSMSEEIILKDLLSPVIIDTDLGDSSYMINYDTILLYGYTQDILSNFIAEKYQFEDVTIGTITDTITNA